MDATMIFTQIVNALMLGCTYTLVAIGFSLFFGVLDVVVFCSGDIAIFGAFAVMGSYAIISSTALGGLPAPIMILLVVIIAAILCAVLGLLTYHFSIKPFEGAPPLMPLLLSLIHI